MLYSTAASMAMHVRQQQQQQQQRQATAGRKRRVFLQSPIVPKVLLCSALLSLAPCLAPAAIVPHQSQEGFQTTTTTRDLLRSKLAIKSTTTTTVTTTTTRLTSTTSLPTSSLHKVMALGLKGRSEGQGRGSAMMTTTASNQAVIFAGDVSDDEDLTLGSGSGFYLQELETDTLRHTQLKNDVQGISKSSPHSSCCFVGKVAASQNLHCHAQYHVDRLKLRSEPMEVTSWQTGTGMRSLQLGRLPAHWTRDMEWCVQKKPLLFQKCCYGYASSKSDRHRWFNHRKTKTGSLQNSYLSWRYIYS
ncbi:uncharacterized protein [Littorina saxatilis]|uniref:uncharacterized protein n=1 Tax=Littorina saxatilis TaxID=31220 RepID=UPI0038B440A0